MQSLFRATSTAINAGVVASTKAARRRFWNAWTEWICVNFPQHHPDLHNASRAEQTTLLAAFAHHVRTGGVRGTKRKVRAQTVQVALRAISSTLILDGKQSPLGSQKEGYPKAIAQQLEGYKREDPPPQPKLAVPLEVPRHMNIIGQGTKCPKQRAIGEIAIIAFFYLLRVGEYTYHPPSEQRRTIQYTIQDIALWSGTTRLPHTLPATTLHKRCTSATLSILDQKSGQKNQSVHQEATGTDTCPITAIIRRLTTIRENTRDPQTCIGAYFPQGACNPRLLHAGDITAAIRQSVTVLRLERHGLSPKLVGSHSLRAGGAMAMYLNGVGITVIKKLGRWASDAFLMYIHEQIAALSANVSTLMSKHVLFHNVHFNHT